MTDLTQRWYMWGHPTILTWCVTVYDTPPSTEDVESGRVLLIGDYVAAQHVVALHNATLEPQPCCHAADPTSGGDPRCVAVHDTYQVRCAHPTHDIRTAHSGAIPGGGEIIWWTDERP